MRKLPQKELASRLGISAAHLGNFEAGRTGLPHEVLERMSSMLGASIEELSKLSSALETPPAAPLKESDRNTLRDSGPIDYWRSVEMNLDHLVQAILMGDLSPAERADALRDILRDAKKLLDHNLTETLADDVVSDLLPPKTPKP